MGFICFIKIFILIFTPILKTETMNVFEKLTDENQAKIKAYDVEFKERHPDIKSHEQQFAEITYFYDLKVNDLWLIKAICGYDTMDDCWLNAFKK